MPLQSVYLESSVISYLTGRNSRDLIITAHQQVTRDWWAQRGSFQLFVSDYVLAEISTGDAEQALLRLQQASEAAILESSVRTEQLADTLLLANALPAKARLDALHIAICAVQNIDYLLTWNCKHIANAKTMSLIERVCVQNSFKCPRLCTPLELTKDE
jgi:predicted nucleic acid-binding protein